MPVPVDQRKNQACKMYTPSVAVPGTASHRRIRLGRREWVDAIQMTPAAADIPYELTRTSKCEMGSPLNYQCFVDGRLGY